MDQRWPRAPCTMRDRTGRDRPVQAAPPPPLATNAARLEAAPPTDASRRRGWRYSWPNGPARHYTARARPGTALNGTALSGTVD